MQRLYLELTSLEDRGITIWLDGYPSNSKSVTSQLCVDEDNSYMRDYVFSEGVLTELHFDNIKKKQN
ncbi:MAG: hypothetical protein J6C37_06470 [Roseburia sp.]|nr:hypothetical protein [Roseburia sp.]